MNDLKYALRQLLKHPGFAAAAIVTLALGIGATTAMFSVIKTVLLDRLPYPDAERLVVLSPTPWMHMEVTQELVQAGDSVEDLAGYYPRQFAVTGRARPLAIEGAEVTPGFFRMLGADLALGRGFTQRDARPGAPRVALIAHALWQQEYGGTPDVIGATVLVDDVSREIVGVLARGFSQLVPRSDRPGLWVPIDTRPVNEDGDTNWMIPLARLRDGVTVQQAQAELDGVLSRYSERGSRLPRSSYRWMDLKTSLVGDARRTLLMLQLAVGLVLLLACVNVANLQLARFASREGELGVRFAMGASSGRIYRQVLTETMVLCLLGGAAGLCLMILAMEFVTAAAPREVLRFGDLSPEPHVLAFALGLSLCAGLLSGLIPAVYATRTAPHRALNEGGRTSAGSTRKHRISQALVVAEVALTLVLLVGAGLLIRSYVGLTGQDPGFRSDDVLVVPVQVPPGRHHDVPQLEAFYRDVAERLQRVPGIATVAVSNRLPIERGITTRTFLVDGESEPRFAQHGIVSPGYFDALGIPLLRGRTIDDTDRRGSAPVTVIDERMWREVWPDEDPIGKRIRLEAGDDHWLTVVGVTGDIRGSGLAAAPAPGFYISYQQRPDTDTELAVGRSAVMLVRSTLPADELAGPLRDAVWEVDPRQPVPVIDDLENVISDGVNPQRYCAVLTGTFAAIALCLAVAGIYGVVSYIVAGRSHEFGIRKAVGASGRDLTREVFAWGFRVGAVGLLLGLAGVSVMGRFLDGLLYGVMPTDMFTIGLSIMTISSVMALACLIPARRAARIDPMEALRHE